MRKVKTERRLLTFSLEQKCQEWRRKGEQGEGVREKKKVKEGESIQERDGKTRAQGAKTDDKYALTSNRDSEEHKGGEQATEQDMQGLGNGVVYAEACAKTCKSPSKQF